jgi:hypothetical protein
VVLNKSKEQKITPVNFVCTLLPTHQTHRLLQMSSSGMKHIAEFKCLPLSLLRIKSIENLQMYYILLGFVSQQQKNTLPTLR